MIIAARLEPPKVISGGEAPARTTSRRSLSFFQARSVNEVVRSQAKKSPADTMRGLKEGVVASSSLRENMFQLRIRALDTRPKYHLL
ncbi:MAG: hypothetical protein WAV78_06650 [Xanthobacteraceae bacterium]